MMWKLGRIGRATWYNILSKISKQRRIYIIGLYTCFLLIIIISANLLLMLLKDFQYLHMVKTPWVFSKLFMAERNAPPQQGKQLILFSTWTRRYGKQDVHQMIIKQWPSISESIQPVLFSHEKEIQNEASSDWIVVQGIEEFNCGKIPTLRGMMNTITTQFTAANLYGYANGDLVFGNNFWETIRVISADESLMNKPLLIVGKRVNVNFNPTLMYLDKEIMKEAKNGAHPIEGSSDIFIVNSLFPWSKVPKLVVGRMGIGMFLVGLARALNIAIIDITDTATMLHLTTKMGIHESSYAKNYSCNNDLILKMGFEADDFRVGSLDCVTLGTMYLNPSKLAIVKRPLLENKCEEKFLKKFAKNVH